MDDKATIRKAIGHYLVRDQIAGKPVYFATDIHTREPVVIKGPAEIDVLNDGRDPIHIGEICLRYEAELHGRLNHPKICQAKGIIEHNGTPYFVMENAGECDLLQFSKETGKVTSKMTALEDAARGLAYAHSQGIIHLDVKEENVVVSEGRAKIIDFGAAREIGKEHPASTDIQFHTPTAVAPEYKMNGKYNTRTDSFTFGYMMHRLLVGRDPYQIINGKIVFTRPKIETERLQRYGTIIRDIVERALTIKHKERPEMKEIADALEEVNKQRIRTAEETYA